MIKINRIKLLNFRQHRNVEITFDDDKGIYLFIGKNGMGKSNFLNAICWCLYNDLPFKSHEDKESSAGIFNEEAIAESDTKVIRAEVELEVIINREKYLFRRVLDNLPVGNTQTEFTVLREKDGGWQIIPNPTYHIDSFLPESMRQFFLFDGEGVKNLFGGDYSTNLKSSIWKVSNIDLLTTTIEHLNTVAGEIRKTLSQQLPELGVVTDVINDINKSIVEKNEKLNNITSEKATLDTNLQDLTTRFKNSATYREQQIKREGYIKEKDQLLVDINEYKTKIISGLASSGAFLYASKEISEYSSQVNKQREKGNMPASIKPVLINDLLDSGVCICNRKIDNDSRNHLNELLHEKQEADDKEFIINDIYLLTSLQRQIKGKYETVLENKRKLREAEQRNSYIEQELKEISDNLINAPEKEIGDIEASMRMLQKESVDNQVTATKLSGEIEALGKQLKDEKVKLEKIADSQGKLKHNNDKLKLLERSISSASDIRDKVIDQIRRSVSSKTNENFRQLMWRDVFKKVEFTDNYKINIQKEGVSEVLDETCLSNGETKVLGFATIKALTELSGFENFPAFIDAPVEQLDQEVEKNLLDMLPNFMPNKQVFVFSLDGGAIVSFGKEHVDRDKLYKLIEREEKSTSTKVVNYYDE